MYFPDRLRGKSKDKSTLKKKKIHTWLWVFIPLEAPGFAQSCLLQSSPAPAAIGQLTVHSLKTVICPSALLVQTVSQQGM